MLKPRRRKRTSPRYDVGIYGLWYGANYGSMLTYYALYRILESFGCSCAMIHNPLGAGLDFESLCRSHSLRFAADHYEITPMICLEEMGRLNETFDRFLLGSDQMWNVDLSRPYRYSYYLDFAAEEKVKVAYATSFGKDTYRGTEDERDAVAQCLRRLSAISVRDDFSRGILRDTFGIGSTTVVDPVFLCPGEEYERLIEEVESPPVPSGEPYVFAYLMDAGRYTGRALSEIAEQHHKRIYVVFNEEVYNKGKFDQVRDALQLSSEDVVCLDDVTLPEWLYLFRNAQAVLTDSFHGTCFSILFEKPFLVRKNDRRGGQRFQHLLSTFGLQGQLIRNAGAFADRFAELEAPSLIDYKAVRLLRAREKGRCLAWLQDALGISGDDDAAGPRGSGSKDSPSGNDRRAGGRKGRGTRSGSAALPEQTSSRLLLAPKSVCACTPWSSCTGCGACVSICPKDALTLRPDYCGYYRPFCNYDVCVNCGLCSKICPALHLPAKSNLKDPECIAFQAAEDALLEASSSGGVFSLLAQEVLQDGGVVAGAAWKENGDSDQPGTIKAPAKSGEKAAEKPSGQKAAAPKPGWSESFTVEHILADSEEGLQRLHKSKYLQSYMGDIDRRIRTELEKGRTVLFSGCPCQIAGLKAYLGRDYEKLFLVDLLCGLAPSAGIFHRYLEECFPQGVQSYQFRYKGRGWNGDCFTLTLTDGSVLVRRGVAQDLYQKAFHSHMMCPPHCEHCPYQLAPRYGDLTIGDFWGYGKHDPSADTKRGLSVILCNNEKGRSLLNRIPDSAIGTQKVVPLDWIGGNGYVRPGCHNWISPGRDAFYTKLLTGSFADAVKAGQKAEEQYREQERIRQQEEAEVQQRTEAVLSRHPYFGKLARRFVRSRWCTPKVRILLKKIRKKFLA